MFSNVGKLSDEPWCWCRRPSVVADVAVPAVPSSLAMAAFGAGPQGGRGGWPALLCALHVDPSGSRRPAGLGRRIFRAPW